MTPTAPTLTTAELARFIGQPVQVIKHDCTSTTGVLIGLNVATKIALVELGLLVQGKIHCDYIRPVLRPVSAMTEGELRECFLRAFPGRVWPDWFDISNKDGMQIKGGYEDDSFYELEANINTLGSYISFGAQFVHDEFEVTIMFNAPAVVDYLDQQGIDCRGYLERKLAVEKPAERENQ